MGKGNVESLDLKCVRSAKLAKTLINKGFVVRDIKPSRDNPEATVFLFERTPELMAIVQSYLDKEQDEKFMREWLGTKRP